eukprot:g1861.t1
MPKGEEYDSKQKDERIPGGATSVSSAAEETGGDADASDLRRRKRGAAAAALSEKKSDDGKTHRKFVDELSEWWWIYDDCCGNFCALFTLFLLCFAYWVQMKYVLTPWIGTIFSWQSALYSFLTFMAIWSHCRAQFTNPGTIPRKYRAPACRDRRYGSTFTCRRTGVLKPPTAHFCREARSVVLKMDHYCPWVNNVVGIFTQKYFLLFVFYTCLCTFFCGVSLAARFVSCRTSLMRMPTEDGKHFTFMIKPWCHRVQMFDAVFSILNFIEAIIFCIFTMCMMWDQYEAIAENTPYIDRLQGKRGKEQAVSKSLREVFGEPPSWRWFFPLAPSASLRDTFAKMCSDTHRAIVEREPPPPRHPVEGARTTGDLADGSRHYGRYDEDYQW